MDDPHPRFHECYVVSWRYREPLFILSAFTCAIFLHVPFRNSKPQRSIAQCYRAYLYIDVDSLVAHPSHETKTIFTKGTGDAVPLTSYERKGIQSMPGTIDSRNMGRGCVCPEGIRKRQPNHFHRSAQAGAGLTRRPIFSTAGWLSSVSR